MKYGYEFHDWNLWSIYEFTDVKDLKEDYVKTDCFGSHTFKKEDWCWVKATKDIFLLPEYTEDGLRHKMTNEGLFLKSHVFDTKEEADEYGKTHSSCFLY